MTRKDPGEISGQIYDMHSVDNSIWPFGLSLKWGKVIRININLSMQHSNEEKHEWLLIHKIQIKEINNLFTSVVLLKMSKYIHYYCSYETIKPSYFLVLYTWSSFGVLQ